MTPRRPTWCQEIFGAFSGAWRQKHWQQASSTIVRNLVRRAAPIRNGLRPISQFLPNTQATTARRIVQRYVKSNTEMDRMARTKHCPRIYCLFERSKSIQSPKKGQQRLNNRNIMPVLRDPKRREIYVARRHLLHMGAGHVQLHAHTS